MMQEGLPVPPGFVVTSAAFAAAVDQERLRRPLPCRRHGWRARDRRSGKAAGRRSSPSITPRSVAWSRCVPRRVRKTSKAASYAGQQESYLDVDGLPAVLDKIVACWLSFFSDRAVFYRAEKGSLEDIAIAVVVQQMIASKKSGVLFTVDPVNGRKDRMVVEAAFGLGENVVNGETHSRPLLFGPQGNAQAQPHRWQAGSGRETN